MIDESNSKAVERFNELMKLVECAETMICRAVAIAHVLKGESQILPRVIEMHLIVHETWQKIGIETKLTRLRLDEESMRPRVRTPREIFDPVFGSPAVPDTSVSYEDYVEQCKTESRAVRYSLDQWLEMKTQKAAEG